MAGFKRRLNAEQDRLRHAMRLADLETHGVGVFCWCNRCSHSAIVPVAELLARLGPAIAVPEIGAKLRCSGCGARDVATRPAWRTLGEVARHDP
jgi:hypothetical protein